MSIAFWPQGRHSRTHSKELSVASKVHLAAGWGCLEEPSAHHRRTNCLLSTCLQKFLLWCSCLPCLVASLSNQPWKAFGFLTRGFWLPQVWNTFLTGFSHAAFQLPCVYSVCSGKHVLWLPLKCLVKKLKWGRYVQHRLMNKTWRVQNEDVKCHFIVLD